MGLTQRTFKTSFQLIVFSIFILFSQAASASQKILVWGDSLSAAYGIPVEKGWVSLMKNELKGKADVINGSVSGETTRGGLSRLASALAKYQPNVIVIELGANDGLRGILPSVTKANLKRMITLSQKAGVKVILLGMKIPPNYGMAYSKRFEAVFSGLAKEYQLPFIPFFLSGIIEKLELLQSDELHPTAEAQPLLLKEVLPTIEASL